MAYKYFLAAIFLVCLSATSFGQLEKTVHQTFDLTEKTTVHLDLYGQYTIVPWAGNNILVETKIQLFNSSASILKHFMEKDHRYQIDADSTNTDVLTLTSHDKKRPSLRTKTGAESAEVVETKVFVPENFIVRDEKTLVMESEKN